MTDDLELRRIQGQKGHAWKLGDDLAVARYDVRIAEIKLAQARQHLEDTIVQHYKDNEEVMTISRKAMTARSVIYRILNKHNLITTTDPLKKDDHASGTQAQDRDRHRQQDQTDHRVAGGY